jgi:hypothetical protein
MFVFYEFRPFFFCIDNTRVIYQKTTVVVLLVCTIKVLHWCNDCGVVTCVLSSFRCNFHYDCILVVKRSYEACGLQHRNWTLYNGDPHCVVQNDSIQSSSTVLLMCNEWLLLRTPPHYSSQSWLLCSAVHCLTLSARHPFQNFRTPCILNVNNTGAKQRSIMK